MSHNPFVLLVHGNYLIGAAVEKVIFIPENVGVIGLFAPVQIYF